MSRFGLSIARVLCCALPALAVLIAASAAAMALEPAQSPPAKTASAERPSSPATQSEPPRQVVRMQLQGKNATGPQLGYGNSQWLFPLDAAPKKLLQTPKLATNKPVYYAAKYGDAKDNVHVLALDESGGPDKGYDVLYADLNNDNRIDPAKERFTFQMGTTSHTEPLRICFQVTAGGVTAPYYVSFSAFPYCDDKHLIEKIHANLRDSSCYEGEAVILGKRRRIAVADLDSNGLFNDVEKGLFHGDRFFVDLDRDEQSQPRGERMASFPYGGYTRIGGKWYTIVASADGSRVEIAQATPALGKIEAPPRIGEATLSSPTQTLSLKLAGGADTAVAGTYRLQSVQLMAEGERTDGVRAMSGGFTGPGPEVTVREGQTTRLAIGLPLKVEPQVVSDEERTLRIALRVSGAGGEVYRLSSRGDSASKTGYEIVDAAGKRVASGEFEYG